MPRAKGTTGTKDTKEIAEVEHEDARTEADPQPEMVENHAGSSTFEMPKKLKLPGIKKIGEVHHVAGKSRETSPARESIDTFNMADTVKTKGIDGSPHPFYGTFSVEEQLDLLMDSKLDSIAFEPKQETMEYRVTDAANNIVLESELEHTSGCLAQHMITMKLSKRKLFLSVAVSSTCCCSSSEAKSLVLQTGLGEIGEVTHPQFGHNPCSVVFNARKSEMREPSTAVQGSVWQTGFCCPSGAWKLDIKDKETKEVLGNVTRHLECCHPHPRYTVKLTNVKDAETRAILMGVPFLMQAQYWTANDCLCAPCFAECGPEE